MSYKFILSNDSRKDKEIVMKKIYQLTKRRSEVDYSVRSKLENHAVHSAWRDVSKTHTTNLLSWRLNTRDTQPMSRSKRKDKRQFYTFHEYTRSRIDNSIHTPDTYTHTYSLAGKNVHTSSIQSQNIRDVTCIYIGRLNETSAGLPFNMICVWIWFRIGKPR